MAETGDISAWAAIGSAIGGLIAGLGAAIGIRKKVQQPSQAAEIRKLEDDGLVMAMKLNTVEANLEAARISIESLRTENSRTIERIFARLEAISIQLAQLGAAPPKDLE